MEKKEHFDEIDIAKGIGILLVIIGHSLPTESYLCTFIYSFHMPLFFILAGLFVKPYSGRVRNVLLSETKLLSSYVWYSFVFILYDIIVRFFVTHKIPSSLLIYNFFITAIFSGISVLWFIATLFWAKILAKLVIRKMNLNNIKMILMSVLLYGLSVLMIKCSPYLKVLEFKALYVFYLTVARVLCAACFILVGYFLGRFVLNKIYSKLLIMGVGVSCFVLLLLFTIMMHNSGQNLDFHLVKIGEYGEALWLGTAGFIVVYIFSKYIITRLNITKKILIFYGQNSLLLMVLHEYFKIRGYIIRIFDYLHVEQSYVLTVVILIIVVTIITLLFRNIDNKILKRINSLISTMCIKME